MIQSAGPVEEGLKPGTISHVALPAEDRRRAQRFYERAFRWEFLDVPEWEYSLFETGAPPGGGIGRALIPSEIPVKGAVNFILVESVEESLHRIEEAGGRVLLGKTEIPATGWYALFQDTEGTTLAVWERAPRRDWPYWRQDLLRIALEDGK